MASIATHGPLLGAQRQVAAGAYLPTTAVPSRRDSSFLARGTLTDRRPNEGEVPRNEPGLISLISRSQPPPSELGWPPPLGAEALYGLPGEIVETIAPQSESDPVALLIQTLAAFGNVIGHNTHFRVEADYHTMNLFCVLVGQTAKARKGTSWGHVKSLMSLVDREWVRCRIRSGLVSGEGLVWQVRDDDDLPDQRSDLRLLVHEPEIAAVLKVTARRDNTLSAMLRQAWDSGHLCTLGKSHPASATDAHISVIGHITCDELRRELNATESANGFANRFLWLCVRRSQILPEGGLVEAHRMNGLSNCMRKAVAFARTVTDLKREEAARCLWREVYPALSEGSPGLFGAVTSRAEAQVTRLSCIYALLDCSATVRVQHLRAALALWKYAEDSARYIFGNASGDAVTEKIYSELSAVAGGLSRTELNARLGHHVRSGDITSSLAALQRENRATMSQERTGGRNVERWSANCERSE